MALPNCATMMLGPDTKTVKVKEKTHGFNHLYPEASIH